MGDIWQYLGAESHPQPTASRKMKTSVLQPQENGVGCFSYSDQGFFLRIWI